MINKAHHIPCMIIRGGTSKGLYFLERDLPTDTAQRDELLLNIMGSPDEKQINGLGGAASVTSKVAIVGVSSVRMRMLIIRSVRSAWISRWSAPKATAATFLPASVLLPLKKVW